MNKNYSMYYRKDKKGKKNADFLPDNLRAIIAGSSGCGKTNLIMNFLLNENILRFSDVYIYCPSLYQPAYTYLQNYFNNIEDYVGKKVLYLHSSDETIVDPSELDRSIQHVMIFDDVMNREQNKIKDYFCMGRHNNVSVFYLCQSLFKIPKHSIRDNCNVFILFRHDDKTMKYFYEMHVSSDMEFKEYKEFCEDAWNQLHGYIVINLWEEPYCGKYLQNYKIMFIPHKYINRNKSK